jgi:hypothetical protein
MSVVTDRRSSEALWAAWMESEKLVNLWRVNVVQVVGKTHKLVMG